MMLRSVGIEMGVSTSGRGGGQSLSGCLERSSLHVSSVCGAIPGEVKTWQALPYRPSCAREIAESTCFLERELSFGWWDFLYPEARVSALSHSSPK